MFALSHGVGSWSRIAHKRLGVRQSILAAQFPVLQPAIHSSRPVLPTPFAGCRQTIFTTAHARDSPKQGQTIKEDSGISREDKPIQPDGTSTNQGRSAPSSDFATPHDSITQNEEKPVEMDSRVRSEGQTPLSSSSSTAKDDPLSSTSKGDTFAGADPAHSTAEKSPSESSLASNGVHGHRRVPPANTSASSGTSPLSPQAHGSASEYVDYLRGQLVERSEEWRSKVAQHAQEKLVEIQIRAKELAQRWNALSGYEEIERLKSKVSKHEHDLHEHRSALQEKREAYVTAVSERSASQRQLSDLLGRKPTWSEQDLATYTSLLHSEHGQARREKQAESAYNDAESAVQEAFDELMRAITQRYHEEHIWSDRMRLVSTWGSVAIAVLNALIFIMALLVVEPYKRRKLANTLETRLLEGEQLNAERMAMVIENVENQIRDLRSSIETLDGDLHETYSSRYDAPTIISQESPKPLEPVLPVHEEESDTTFSSSPPEESQDIPATPARSRFERAQAGIHRAAVQAWERHGELVVAGTVGAAVAILGMAAGQVR